MKVTQHQKILDLFYTIQKAHTLFFISSTKLNSWEVKKDRHLFLEKNIITSKANTYRSVQLLNKIPIFKGITNSISGPFFIAGASDQQSYNDLLNLFNINTQYMRVFLAIQNNIFFSKNRIMLAQKLKNKNNLAWPLTVNSFYFLISSVYFFLLTSIRNNIRIN